MRALSDRRQSALNEWGESQARPTRPAGAGLNATVRAAAIKWSSSMATEPTRP